MANDKKKRENRFTKNHPVIDPNDPAILITAGLIGQETAEEDAQGTQEPPEQVEEVTAPTEPEKPANEPTGDAVTIPLDEIGAVKKAKKRSSTLYLTDSVLNQLRSRSKKAGMSSSEYLDELLKRAFGIE